MYFATTNKNKLTEAKQILGINVKGIKLELDEIQTLDPEECVRKKAITAYYAFGKPILVEDTSLFFEAWNGLPGVFIDYFLKSVEIIGLLKMLTNAKNRKANAITYLGIFNGQKCKLFKGEVEGKIAQKPKGKNGFGWDSIFIPKGHSKTFAEMNPGEKNMISMRKQALSKFKKEINRVLR